MTDNIPPTGPGSPSPLPGGASPGDAPGGYFKPGGTGWSSFEEWMGKSNFALFQKNLCQAIVQQIGKDKEKEHKAAQRLKLAEEGKDMYDVE